MKRSRHALNTETGDSMIAKMIAQYWGILFVSFLITAQANAAQGLVIHSAEFGVGKFHRKDNQVNTYSAGNAWLPYVLPDNAKMDQPLLTDNADGSVTVYFSTLDELLSSVVKISKSRHQPVSVLNIHGHGLPGGMWFPKDAQTLGSFQCADWKDAASGSDQANYDQYYSAVSTDEIMQIRSMSNGSAIQMGCITGLNEWKGAVAKNPEFKSTLASNVQLHFLSCVVGLGKMGETFTQGVAGLLLPPGSAGRVETSMNFGLGDWSMPEGMGFWDYQSEAQVNRDNENYVVHHKDLEIAQKGTVRMVSSNGSAFGSTLLTDRGYMALGFETEIRGTVLPKSLFELRDADIGLLSTRALPSRVRVPGTAAYVELK
jgi:hypothetical protein